MSRRIITIVVGVIVALVLVFVAGPYVYIHFIEGDPPPRATVSDSTDLATPTGSVEGTWTVSPGSQTSYRVGEVLFGQSTEAVGTTTGVTGSVEIAGTQVTKADLTADMTTVKSSESRRDGRFRSEIMQTSKFPTATFTLTKPIELTAIPADTSKITATATGQLTLRGVTKEVTFTVNALRSGPTIRIDGIIPIMFADYDIPDGSIGPAVIEDHGQIELLVVLTQA